MADTKVSALTDGTTANATDRIPVARSPFGSGDNRYITPAYLDTYMASTTKTLTNKTLTSPVLTTPTLGVASATSINKITLTAPATGSTLTIADGKTLTANNSITFAGTDSTTMTFPSTSATIARTDAGNTFTGAQTISGGTVNGTVLSVSQTWGSTGTYTGLLYNVTDSGPANTASLLMDLQKGTVSQFSVSKNGLITSAGTGFSGSGNGGAFSWAGGVIGNSSTTPFFQSASANMWFGTGGSTPIVFSALSGTNVSIDLVSDTGRLRLGASSDVILSRAAAATLQLGAADAASPVAQTLQVQSSTSTNNNGANWTFTGSKSAGSGTSGSIIFKTGATGAASGTTNTTVTALTIGPATTNNTNVGYPSVVVGSGAAVATNATDGFLYISSCAGTPSGTPTSYTGAVPIVFDTTGVKIWVYTGGAWKGVVVA